MAQNAVFPAVAASALLIAKPTASANPDIKIQYRRKLIAVTIAETGGAGALLQLYDNVDASDATKLIYQVDGSIPHSPIEINFPFSQLYAKISVGGKYNIIYN